MQTIFDCCQRYLPLAFGIVLIGGLVGWRSVRFNRLYGRCPILIPCADDASAHAFLSRVLPVFFGVILVLGALAAFWPGGLESADLLYRRPGPALMIIGLALATMAGTLVWRGQVDMAAAWRIGVNPDERTELVTRGLFRFCRNPIYLGLQVALVAFCCLLPGYFSLEMLLLGAVLLQIQARLEESHLLEQHGPAYAAYCARVGRFLPFTGRFPAPVTPRREKANVPTD